MRGMWRVLLGGSGVGDRRGLGWDAVDGQWGKSNCASRFLISAFQGSGEECIECSAREERRFTSPPPLLAAYAAHYLSIYQSETYKPHSSTVL